MGIVRGNDTLNISTFALWLVVDVVRPVYGRLGDRLFGPWLALELVG